MPKVALLIDRSPAYLRIGKKQASLLAIRVGSGTLLKHWCDRLLRAEVETVAVVPHSLSGNGYAQEIRSRAPEINLLRSDQIGEFLQGRELADRLIVIDSRYYPVGTSELISSLTADHDQFVTHLTCPSGGRPGISEHVVVDPNRRVQRIERLYTGVTDLGSISVVCSLMSVAAARYLRKANQFALGELRAAFVTAGIPTRDICLADLVIDLGVEQGLLNLNEYMLRLCSNSGLEGSFEQIRPGVWAAPGCRIHRASKLFGPAVFSRNGTIEAHARVIGPVALGVGATVGSGTILCRCIVGDHVRVPAGSRFINRVLLANTSGAADSEAASWAEQLEAEQVEHAIRQASSRQQMNGAVGESLYTAGKRVLDFTAALCSLIALFPLLGIVALMIKLTSRGPVFFGDSREGRGGRFFRCWKFRTMVARAHLQQRALYIQNAVDGPQFKLRDDPRVTPLGRILRATNIDELPQLFNVLQGDMSLVGPRPSPFRENQICIPWREARLSVLPGITGLWQVCRHNRDDGDFHQWIYFDTVYAQYRSFALDMRILLATFLTLGGRWGAPISWMIPGHGARRTILSNGPNGNKQVNGWSFAVGE